MGFFWKCLNIFIFLGIGIDDVFILMFGIVDVEFIEKLSVFDWISFMMRISGIVIIIILIMDFLVFLIGVSLVFISVRNFCIYIGNF